MSKFKKYATRIREAIPRIAKRAGNAAVNDFQDNFNKQGFDGVPWEEVERRKEGTNAYKYPKREQAKRTRAILTETGNLLRSISLVSVDNGEIVIQFLEYGKYHNEGGSTEGRFPKRQFAGITKDLQDKFAKIIEEELKKAIK